MTTYVLHTETARAGCAAVIARLPIEPVYQVVVTEYKSTRSLQQNARYWVLISAIASGMPPHMDGVWHAPEVWHTYFKRSILGVESFWMPKSVFGETVYEEGSIAIPRSTRKLKVKEFAAYMEEVEAWAAEHGILLDNWQT